MLFILKKICFVLFIGLTSTLYGAELKWQRQLRKEVSEAEDNGLLYKFVLLRTSFLNEKLFELCDKKISGVIRHSITHLIQSGADINGVNVSGETPLDIALVKGNIDMIYILKCNGGRVSTELQVVTESVQDCWSSNNLIKNDSEKESDCSGSKVREFNGPNLRIYTIYL